MGEDGFALDCVERLAHLGGRVLVVIQIADEGGDGALEVDVVLPEGIVGVDEQGLAGRELGHEVMVANRSGRVVEVRVQVQVSATAWQSK